MASGLAVDISMLGDKALMRKLKRLPAAAQKKAVRPALRKDLSSIVRPVMLQKLSGNPVGRITGQLFAAMKAQKVTAKKRSRSLMGVHIPLPPRDAFDPPLTDDNYYPNIVEYTPGKSYIRAAENETHSRSLAFISREIGKGIEREAARA